MTTSKYFQSEMESLRGLAEDFSKEHPTLAPHLASSSTDPDVERILEGTAFLTASIRKKIDDDFPEFAQGLLKHIFPHYLKDLPCATIMQFRPKSILKNRLDVAKSTYIDSVEIDGVKNRFQTIKPMTAWPLKINSANQSETTTGKKYIALEFEFTGLTNANSQLNDLELHLAGGFHIASDLLYILHNHVERVEVVSNKEDVYLTNQCEVVVGGFAEDDALLKYPSNSFPAYRLIQEYFLLKEKFLYITLKNIGSALKQVSGNRFKIHFILKDNSPVLPRFNKDSFMLNTVPAVNLFEHDATSIQNDFKQFEYHIKPIRNELSQYHIHSVDSVVGLNRKTATRTEYKVAGLSDPDQNTQSIFQINTRQDGAHAESFISFAYPSNVNLDYKETLQISLTCSNGALAEKCREGDISVSTSNTSELLEFSNVIKPSAFQVSPSGQSLSWRLLSHLSLNYLSLADTENFKSLLSLYIFSSDSGSKQESINRKKIEGIREIKVKACDRLVKGIPMRGQSIYVTINASHFSSKGDMYLFGLLMDYLFSSFASLNCFTELVMTDETSDETFRFPAKAGVRLLI